MNMDYEKNREKLREQIRRELALSGVRYTIGIRSDAYGVRWATWTTPAGRCVRIRLNGDVVLPNDHLALQVETSGDVRGWIATASAGAVLHGGRMLIVPLQVGARIEEALKSVLETACRRLEVAK